MGVPIINTGPMTIEEFYAFTDRQPDEEKWELIDGEPVLNASPTPLHQWIVRNLVIAIAKREPEQGASWGVLPGLGIRVSSTDRPEPDVLILPRVGPSFDPLGRDRSDVIVAFEVLSPSTEDRDLNWKRAAYTKLASLTHYVVVAQDEVEVVVFARENSFAERRLRALRQSIAFSSLRFSLPLSGIYRDTGLVGTLGD